MKSVESGDKYLISSLFHNKMITMGNNKGIPVPSKEESLKLMRQLMSEGILKRADLERNGVRHCTIVNFWRSEKDYLKYSRELAGLPEIKPINIYKRKPKMTKKKIISISKSIESFWKRHIIEDSREKLDRDIALRTSM